MSDLAELKRKTYAVLRDSEKAFIEDQTVEDWINEAYLDLCARLRLPEVTTSGTTSGTGTIALPAGLVEIKRLWIDGGSMTWVDSEVFTSYSVPGDLPPRSIYRIWDNTIETYPAEVSEDYQLEYIGKPTLMDSVADEPVELPEELHLRLAFYAQGQAKMVEGELDEAAYYIGQYERGLPDLPRAAWRGVPGPLSLMPEPNIINGTWV